MALSYKGLFQLLESKGISKTELKSNAKLSSATLAKLSKNETVSLQIIEKICKYLDCQPGDIMLLEDDIDTNSLLYILKEEKNMKLKGGIYHQTQVKLAYNSNHIEGSRLTEDQTRYIFETNTIGLDRNGAANIDDIIETINHFICFDYIIDIAQKDLTENMIKNMHYILKTHTSDSRIDWFAVGEYKRKPNMIGDTKTTPPSQVPKAMRKLLFEYHQKDIIDINDIVDFHYEFEKIHPFQDGNGRVGRLIMFKECLKHNIVPFIIEDQKKMFYYRGLKNYPDEKGWLVDTCLDAQDNYQLLLNYFLETE